MRRPTLESSAERRIRRLKRRLVLELFLQRGRFWDAVRDVRTEWNVTARRMLPSDGDLETYAPVDQAPEKPAPYKATKSIGLFFDRWRDALRRPLRDGFVPDELKRWLSWDDFFGACVMCDPPDDRLLEFAEFGHLYPIVFWPVVDRELTEIDAIKLHSMVAPPIERVFKESYEEGEPSFEYRIVVDGETREQDVINACRAIKAAYGQSAEDASEKHADDKRERNPLVAVQCAILYDHHNARDSTDKRRLRWSHKRLAESLGLPSAGSAKAHIALGREILEKNRVQ